MYLVNTGQPILRSPLHARVDNQSIKICIPTDHISRPRNITSVQLVDRNGHRQESRGYRECNRPRREHRALFPGHPTQNACI